MELTNVKTSLGNMRYFVSKVFHHLDYLRIHEPVMDREGWATFCLGALNWAWSYRGKQISLSDNVYDLLEESRFVPVFSNFADR